MPFILRQGQATFCRGERLPAMAGRVPVGVEPAGYAAWPFPLMSWWAKHVPGEGRGARHPRFSMVSYQPPKFLTCRHERSSPSWPAQAGHPRLAVLVPAEGVDGGPAAAMAIGGRCQRVRNSGAWYQSSRKAACAVSGMNSQSVATPITATPARAPNAMTKPKDCAAKPINVVLRV